MVVLAKRDLDEGATAWAQGGIVGVLGSDDSVDSHVRDTQDAGAGLVDEHTARFIAEQQRRGRASGWSSRACRSRPTPSGPLGLHLTREGGHAVRRIAHAADATGAPSTTRCSPRRARIRTSRCASAGWRST